MTQTAKNIAAKKLSGQVALITGGARGIGAAIARRLADDGADVAISYSQSATKAEELVKELRGKGIHAHAFKADQADTKQVEKLVSDVASHFGSLNILVNNAGVYVTGTVDSAEATADLDRQFAVNVGGVVTAIRAASKIISPNGRIISIGSVVADRTPFSGAADYSATKAAVAAYNRVAARDLAGKGITVNTVQPGPIGTDMNPEDSEFADQIRSVVPLGRYGRPEEIASAVAYLASPEASYITGTTLTVDGGFSA